MSNVGANSPSTFAEKYGVCRSSVYAQIKTGRLRAVKVGARTIITPDDEREWLANLPQLKADQDQRKP